MGIIYVTSFQQAESVFKRFSPKTIISLISPNSTQPEFNITLDQKWSIFRCLDIEVSEEGAPDKELIENLINLGQRHNISEDMLIHCHRGMHRSTAAALIILASINRARNSSELAKFFTDNLPYALPNQLMLELYDRQKQTNGSLWESLYGKGLITSTPPMRIIGKLPTLIPS